MPLELICRTDKTNKLVSTKKMTIEILSMPFT